MQSNQGVPDHSLAPRSGAAGWLDRLAGPGATRAELALQFVPAVIAAVVAPLYAVTLDVDWTGLQLAIIALLGFDLVGGVPANATGAAKRWFHRPGQGWRQQFGFVVLHLVHIAVVAMLFRTGDGYFFGIVGGYLLVAALLILATPLYLQRPVGLGLYVLALVGSEYLFSSTPGLEWFLPLLFLKLLVCHLIAETPFRPKPASEPLASDNEQRFRPNKISQ